MVESSFRPSALSGRVVDVEEQTLRLVRVSAIELGEPLLPFLEVEVLGPGGEREAG